MSLKKTYCIHLHHPLILALVGMLLTVSMTGCASKSQAIQAGAAGFSSESVKAIDLLDKLVIREVEDTQNSQVSTPEVFVAQVLHKDTKLDRETLTILIDPFANRKKRVKQEWHHYLSDLTETYRAYSHLFHGLETGAVFSADEIEEAIPLTKKLAANMAALSNHWAMYPAQFNTDYATLQMRFKNIRLDKESSEKSKSRSAMLVRQQFKDLMEAEKQMTQALVEQSHKAALTGYALTGLLEDFNEITVDDITEAIAKAFELAATIPGLELGNLQEGTNKIITELNKDSASKDFLNAALKAMPGRPQ